MENLPTASEVDADKKESRKSKSRKPETIGSLAVKPESAGRNGLERPPEANWLQVIQQAPEHIGHMLMAATEPETKASSADKPAPETVKISVEKSAELSPRPGSGKRIDTLSRAELLSLSETIIIDGSSLRQIYETHLVGEHGLRRLIAEHLRGGDLKKALQREIVEREIDFERDPILRDMVPQEPSSTSGMALEKLLERATINLNDSSEEAAFFKARATYEVNQLHLHKKQRRVIDASLAGVIAVLLALIITLYLSHN